MLLEKTIYNITTRCEVKLASPEQVQEMTASINDVDTKIISMTDQSISADLHDIKDKIISNLNIDWYVVENVPFTYGETIYLAYDVMKKLSFSVVDGLLDISHNEHDSREEWFEIMCLYPEKEYGE